MEASNGSSRGILFETTAGLKTSSTPGSLSNLQSDIEACIPIESLGR